MSRVENPYNLGSGAKVGGMAAGLMKQMGSNFAAIAGARTEIAKFHLALQQHAVERERDRTHEIKLAVGDRRATALENQRNRDALATEANKQRTHEVNLASMASDQELRSKNQDNEHEARMTQLHHENNMASAAAFGSLAEQAANRGQNVGVKSGQGNFELNTTTGSAVKKVNRELGEHLPEQHRKAYIMGSAAQKAALTRKYGAA